MGNDWNGENAKMDDKISDNAMYGKWGELSKLRKQAMWSRRMARLSLTLSIFAIVINIVNRYV